MISGKTQAASQQSHPAPTVELGHGNLTIEDVVAVAEGRATIRLNPSPEYRRRVQRTREHVDRHIAEGRRIYGVTTGFGDSVVNDISREYTEELAENLYRFHGCGTGRTLSPVESCAVLVVRLASLSKGYSGVRDGVMETICGLVRQRVLPCIPAEGSVGASGDLTPLSYVAAVVAGEREVTVRGEVTKAGPAMRRAGIEPVRLLPKESLSIMNGTSVMTALACLAFEQSLRLARLASTLTAMASDTLRGNAAHFDRRIFELKPHWGTQMAAGWIRSDLAYEPSKHIDPERLQDRYSLRCAPHVVGTLLDALVFVRSMVETELNSVNDNPVVDPDTGDVLHCGNFYGGHVGMAMDTLKTAVASVADLMDRQLELLCNPTTNAGLPANLAESSPGSARTRHGFKAMQISASALTAEALKATMPATSFSRSTECHNQDKVSMGTIAARDCLRVLELTETVAAILLLAVCQAVDLRETQSCREKSAVTHSVVRQHIPKTTFDRRHDSDIQLALKLIRNDELPIGEFRGIRQ